MAAPPLTPPASQKSSTGGGSATATRHGVVPEAVLSPLTAADAEPEPPRSGLGQLDTGLDLIELLGMSLARCSEPQLLDAVFAALEKQRGGWLITANLDFLRRYYKDPRMQVLYSQADLRVADGMPLVWAAYLQGTPLPERIAGASLLRPLASRAAREGRSIYFLGGNGNSAEGASRTLKHEFPELRVAGFSSPWLPVEPDD